MIPPLVRTGRKIECFACCARESFDAGFFDLFHPRPEELDAVIGSIEGGGLAESVLTAGLQVSLRCLIRQKVAMADAVGEINRIFWELAPDKVQGTLLSARADAASRSIRYINAGHHTAILLRTGGGVEYLEPTAPPLALCRKNCFRERRLPFEPGDVFITASGDIGRATVNELIGGYLARMRRRDWPAAIAEEVQRGGPRIVMVVSYRDEENRSGAHGRPVAPPVMTAAA
ncbi:MAG: SpoIIE family protein phosphatase [Acidobacteriota bacterium]|nr:SpoIIE family protein phosphatase [Acidobacteriota bacterium]